MPGPSRPSRQSRNLSVSLAALLLASVFFAFTLLACGCHDSDSSGQAPTPKTDYSHTIAELQKIIPQVMDENGAVGLSIALVDRDATVWTAGFGYVDREAGEAATPDSLFKIGSVSKTMTAMAVMREVEAGRLSLDDRLADLLPEFSTSPSLRFGGDPMANITVQSLLTHQAGIPGDLLNGGFATEEIPDYDQRLMDWLRTDHTDYPVGRWWAYSNTGTCLLADVVAAVSGQSFAERTREMFDLMGMGRTSYYLGPDAHGPGYIQDQPQPAFWANIVGAGSVTTSANEMSRYMQTMLTGGHGQRGQVLKPETIKTMWTPYDEGNRFDPGLQGLIWVLTDPALRYAGRVAWHNGSTILFRSHLILLPEHGLGVFVVTNTFGTDAVVNTVAHQALQLALEDKEGITPPEPPTPEPSPAVTWSDEALDALTGAYATKEGYWQVVRQNQGEDKGLLLTPDPWTPDAAPTFVVPRANGLFSAPDFPASGDTQYELATYQGQTIMAEISHGFRNPMAERVPAYDIPQPWLDRQGHWQAIDQDPGDFSLHLPEPYTFTPSFDLITTGNMLVMDDDGARQILVPVSDTKAYTFGFGRNKGMAVQYTFSSTGEPELRYQMFTYEAENNTD